MIQDNLEGKLQVTLHTVCRFQSIEPSHLSIKITHNNT